MTELKALSLIDHADLEEGEIIDWLKRIKDKSYCSWQFTEYGLIHQAAAAFQPLQGLTSLTFNIPRLFDSHGSYPPTVSAGVRHPFKLGNLAQLTSLDLDVSLLPSCTSLVLGLKELPILGLERLRIAGAALDEDAMRVVKALLRMPAYTTLQEIQLLETSAKIDSHLHLLDEAFGLYSNLKNLKLFSVWPCHRGISDAEINCLREALERKIPSTMHGKVIVRGPSCPDPRQSYCLPGHWGSEEN